MRQRDAAVELDAPGTGAHHDDVDLARSSFYTDSYNDRPMLERVGQPIAVNPDVRLQRLARQKGWPIEIWDAP